MYQITQKIKHLYHLHGSLENGVLLLALVLAGGILWSTLGSLQRNFSLQQQVDNLKQQNEVLKLENQLLGFQQQYYKSDEFLELSAKEHLNKVQPGEKVIILPHAEPKPDDDIIQTAPTKTLSNFQQWLVFLFGDRER